MHFFSPVPVMPLVELVRGTATTEATASTIRELSADLGKQVIVSADRPGFIVNRMLMPFLAEAMRAFEEGVGSADDIDAGARIGLNHPMGPLELADFIGLDVCSGIMEVLHEGFGEEHFAPPRVLVELVESGHLGQKTGRGFHDYPQGRPLAREDPGHRPLDALDVERLREQRDAARVGDGPELGVCHVAGHEREPACERRCDLRDGVVERGAAHRAHPVVAEDRVRRVVADDRERGSPVAREDRLVADPAQDPGEELADRGLVVDDEDAGAAAAAAGVPRLSASPARPAAAGFPALPAVPAPLAVRSRISATRSRVRARPRSRAGRPARGGRPAAADRSGSGG